jgi:RNA polymerase sigma-70 factor (ECF subfamily)
VDGLPPRYRAAVTLFYLEERDYTEVAGVLGIPVGTLKTHLHRARAMLREALAGDAPDSGRNE